MGKQQLLEILTDHLGEPVSGEQIAEKMGVSRAAVWKAVKALQGEGYEIASSTNVGYTLLDDGKKLSGRIIGRYLHTKRLGRKIDVFPQLDSTNTYLKTLPDGQPEGYTVLAEQQSQGKGRRGRSFSSPPGQGLYMSFLLRPMVPIGEINLITVITALSVYRAVERTTGVKPQIKWVNDVLWNGKKLCGILTEASLEAESGSVSSLVVGLGINVGQSREDFDPSIADIAGSLYQMCGSKIGRNRLAAEVLDAFEEYYDMLLGGNRAACLRDYREKILYLGEQVRVIDGSREWEATALDIDENAMLVVRDGDGKLHTLNSAEISVRPGRD